jgi:hypothetical protein
MASVWLGGGLVDLPPVCVKTGLPTPDVLRLAGRAAPSWVAPMVLVGFLPWLLARAGASRRYEVEVPLSAAVWQRFRIVRSAMRAAALVGLASSALAAATGAAVATVLVLCGVAVVGGVGLLVNEWVNWFGVRLSPDGQLGFTRVHRDFVDSVARFR